RRPGDHGYGQHYRTQRYERDRGIADMDARADPDEPAPRSGTNKVDDASDIGRDRHHESGETDRNHRREPRGQAGKSHGRTGSDPSRRGRGTRDGGSITS